MSIEEQVWMFIEPRLRTLVREEITRQFDEPVSRKWISELFGVTLGTVDNWIKRGIIKRINPIGGHPKFSRNQIMKLYESKNQTINHSQF